jgi:hypothetical protein
MQASTVISIISLALCVLFFAYCKRYLKRRTGQERILAEFKDEVYKLISEIDAATDRDATIVEERVKALKTLLEDVDKRIGLHAQEMSRRRINEETYAELGRKRPLLAEREAGRELAPSLAADISGEAGFLASGTHRNRLDGAARELELMADEGTEADSHRRRGTAREAAAPASAGRGVAPPVSGPQVILAPEIRPKSPPLTEQVVELARAGFAPELIAARLGVSISEVELAIAIAEQRS